jgi:hypothetical protein
MNLGISQLQFTSKEDLLNSINILRKYNVKNIEVVFSKINSDLEYLNLFSDLGLSTKSTQSILFNSGILDIADDGMIPYICKLSDRCKSFGVQILVLGSPLQRVNYSKEKLIEQLSKIDQIMAGKDQYLCIEPNCKKYRGNYFFTIKEIVNFIKDGNFSNIKTMIDTHNLINEGESPSKNLEEFLPYIYHVHVSENDLRSFIKTKEHLDFAEALKNSAYDKLVTYEVLPLEDLDSSLNDFASVYGF